MIVLRKITLLAPLITMFLGCAPVNFGTGTLSSPAQTSSQTNPQGSGTCGLPYNNGPFETPMGTPLTIPLSTILTNDGIAQGTSDKFGILTQPNQGGTLTFNGTSFTFTPTPGFVGTSTFSYSVTTPQGCNGNVVVQVNTRTVATQAVYAQSPTTLFQFDTNWNPITLGQFTYNGEPLVITDIAISSQGLLYGVSSNGYVSSPTSASIYSIDPLTGDLGLIKSFDGSVVGDVTGLAFISTNQAVIGGNGLFIFDISTGVLTTLVAPQYQTYPPFTGLSPTLTLAYQTDGDVILLPDGNLYWTVLGTGNDFSKLYRVNPNVPGAAVPVLIATLTEQSVLGLGYENGLLIGFSQNGDIFNIDPTSGVISGKRPNPSVSGGWGGATTNPVTW